MTFPELHPNLTLDLLALVIGLCVGSYLNVVALRSLAEESFLWPPSKCPRCNHSLAPWDNIPVLSWLLLKGRCRYCAGPISWQYPLVELFTGLTFVAIERVFLDPVRSPFNNAYWNHVLVGFLPDPSQIFLSQLDKQNWLFTYPTMSVIQGASTSPESMVAWAIGAVLLACTLIAVTVTDFREKLIPHEITYPSMLIGLAFSHFVRHDLTGALAGIGVSYILFDFIAFYGLKVYLMSHGDFSEGRPRRLKRRLTPRKRRRLSRGLKWRLDLATIDKTEEQEPVEVMGGGDAVLSAVMSAYFGWQLLAVALIIGFVTGTLMGLLLLTVEMRKANLLHKCGQNALIGAVIGATACGCFGLLVDHVISQGATTTAIPMAILGASGGFLLGVITVGTRVSKPYPFGPALAAGGFISIFLLPNWVYLQAAAHMQH